MILQSIPNYFDLVKTRPSLPIPQANVGYRFYPECYVSTLSKSDPTNKPIYVHDCVWRAYRRGVGYLRRHRFSGGQARQGGGRGKTIYIEMPTRPA